MHVHNSLQSLAGELSDNGGDLPLGMDVEQAFRQMLARGVIQGDRNRVYSCPIPSLESWIACGGSPLHQEVMRGDADGVADLIATGANPAALDLRGRTAFQLACEEGWDDIAGMLEAVAEPEDDRASPNPFDSPAPNGGHQG